MLRSSAFLVVVVLAAGAAAPAAALDFVITPGGASQVVFQSKAPMESFDGKTHKLSGTVGLDPSQLTDSIAVHVDVDMASFDTGIDMRNTHMRENHLHTAKFPTATFSGGKLAELSAKTLAEGQKVTGTITGTMRLHGVEKPLQAPIELTYQGGALHVVSHFKIKLADYEIPRPQFLALKLNDEQSVSVEIDARPKP